jgi:hypothetical protein
MEKQPRSLGRSIPKWTAPSPSIEHERGKYVCPLMFPERAERDCPIQHEMEQKGLYGDHVFQPRRPPALFT